MEGMKDWNKMSIEEYIAHLEEKFLFDSSGTAKCVNELIRAYKGEIESKSEPKSEKELEDIFDQAARKQMIQWDIRSFKKTHPRLIKAVAEAMKEVNK